MHETLPTSKRCSEPRSWPRDVFAVVLLLAWSPWAIPTGFAADPIVPSYSLKSVLDLALARNPTLGSATGLIEEHQGHRTAAEAYPNPTVSGNLGRGEIRDTGRANLKESLTRESLTEFSATIGQPLEWPAKRAARQSAADAGVAAASTGLVETQLNLAAGVKIAFYELLLAQRDLELAKQNGQIVEDVRRIVNTRVKLGEAPRFEAVKAEVEVLKANQIITRADNAVRVARVTLDTLTAGALGGDYAIHGDFESFRQDMSLKALLARTVEQHPTLQRLTKQIEQADRTVELERHSRVPNITVSGSYWREIGREAVSAGLSLPTPLWYNRQGEIAAALGNKRREEAEWLRARNGLMKEVNQHFQDAQTTATLIDVFEKGLLKQAQEALRVAQFSFQQGASSLLEVLDAQRVQREILMEYAQARFDLSVSLARLERAVGGLL
ncbi:MAG: TolC family protein [Nitrospiraceae bacterium]|nr:TolC family protein [Nitrospiraceae bacterium]